ncbi:MAG: glycosyltransferase family 39 protein [Anaerolineae bacterium]
MMNGQQKRLMVLVIVLLLFAAWLRTRHMVDFVEWPDEIWSAWQVRGTFPQAMTRVAYDWPPLYSAAVWAGMQLVGQTLEALRYLMILLSVLSITVLYRAAIHFYSLFGAGIRSGRYAAFVAVLIFTGMGYAVFTGVEVRAYGMLLLIGAVALWVMLRWLQQPQDWRLMVILGTTLALTIYGSFTSLIFIAFLTLVIVILCPRLLIRWILVGVVTLLLVMPIVPQFLANASERVSRTSQTLPPFVEALLGQYKEYGGTDLFVVALAVAVILLIIYVWQHRASPRLVLAITLWALIPAGVYIGLGSREFLTPRYTWWVTMGLALLIGAVTLFVRIRWRLAIAGFAVVTAVLPVNFMSYRVGITGAPPMRMVLSWFAQHIRPGDVLIKDPYCQCGEPIAWDYFLPQFFPEGYLPIVEHPRDHARVWYLATSGWQQDDALLNEIKTGRKESIFVGPWNFLLRLYEGPPLRDGVTLGNQVTLNGFEIDGNRETFAEDDTIKLKLWWSLEEPIDFDYSISIALFDQFGNLVTQMDGPAQAVDTPQQMSQWQPGVYYEDLRDIPVPVNTAYEDYQLAVTVYDWRDNQRLTASDNPYFGRMGDDGNYLLLRHIHVVSY